ncbi:hypothetical protein [Mycoplasma sp. 4423]
MSKVKINTLYKAKYLQKELYIFNTNIISKLKSLNFKGSQHLGFDDIAINYSVKGFNNIINFCNLLYKNNIKYLLVIASKQTQLMLQSALEFIFGKYDFYSDVKIKLIFINNEDTKVNIESKIYAYFHHCDIKHTGIMFLDVFDNINKLKSKWLVELVLSKFNQHASEFFVQKLIYFIGKKEWFANLAKYNIPDSNILFVSSSVHNQFSFFSELYLVLLATQGVNLNKLIHGYKNISESIYANDSYFNKALGMFLHLVNFYNENNTKKDISLNIFVGYDDFLENLSKVFAYHFNMLTVRKKVFNDSCVFSRDISSIGQSILSNGLPKTLFYFVFKRKYFDYQLSSNIDFDDLLSNLSNFTLHAFKNTSLNSFNNYFISYIDDSKSVEIEIANNDEEALGELIGLLYWSKILYAIYYDLDLFT